MRRLHWAVLLLAMAVAATVALSLATVPRARANGGDWDVVMTGLNSPRGLDFAPNGALYVAEAGYGGNIVTEVEGSEISFGMSGSVSRYFKGKQTRVAEGLPSFLSPEEGAVGPSDITFAGFGNAALTIGGGFAPEVREAIAAEGGNASDSGTLWRVGQGGKGNRIADMVAYEAANDPDGTGIVDSNVNSAYPLKGGGYVVADAGGNSLLKVDAAGHMSTLAVFPPGEPVAFELSPPEFPAEACPPDWLSEDGGILYCNIPPEAVPTSVVQGPDGALYVGQLTGFPFPPGAAKVFRVTMDGTVTDYATGFTNIMDLDFDANGNLYVLEISSAGLLTGPIGSVVTVEGGSRGTVVATDLIMPGGMAIGPDGGIYVSNCGACGPGDGEVVRIEP